MRCVDICEIQWPKYLNNTETILRPYWENQGDITVIDGLLLYGQRITIPSSERLDILQRIHNAGHQGISRCQELARQSVWWPGLSTSTADSVANTEAELYSL